MPEPTNASTTTGPDLTALTDPIDPGALQNYRSELKRMRQNKHAEARSDRLGRVLWRILLVIGGVLAAAVAGAIGYLAWLAVSSGNPLVAVLLVVGAVVIVALIVIGDRRAKRKAETRLFRLLRFTRANGLDYAPERSEPLPGLIFGTGRERATRDIVTGSAPRRVEFGNHSYTTGSGRYERTHLWGYVAIRLGTPLPHIVLDATSNDGKHGDDLPTSFKRAQRLRLEGDFDRHFALYVPEGYEADALYIFTPDVMARFVDTAARLDVEIVDDWMFLYLPAAEATSLDADRWAWLMHVVRTLLQKMEQWERWRDERLLPERREDTAAGGNGTSAAAAGSTGATAAGATSATAAGSTGAQGGSPFALTDEDLMRPPPGVDEEGKRLHRGLPVGSIVGVVVIIGGLIGFALML